MKSWLDKHPRFHLHFTPKSSSWLNRVEHWFRDPTDKALRRGVFHSVPDLIEKIEDYIQTNNEHPKPLVWVATADFILEKVARGPVALETAKQPPGKTETLHQMGVACSSPHFNSERVLNSRGEECNLSGPRVP